MKGVLVLAWVAIGSIVGHAFVSFVNEAGRPLRWNLVTPPAIVHTNVVNRATKAVRYYIASDAYSAANREAELNAVRACFAQWQAVPGTHLRFEEGGLAAPPRDINTADNTNVIFWAKQSTLVNGALDDIRGLRGYTVTAYAPDHTLLEADTVLNGVDFAWQTDLNNPRGIDPFIEATLLHEIGHFIGLDHTPVGGASLFKESGPGLSTEAGLSSDEISAARALYPAPGVLAGLGHLRGRITMAGSPVFGAIVVAETGAGNIAAGTVSRVNGSYELPALAPGAYQVRVSPLDPTQEPDHSSLIRGPDIAIDYETVESGFLPTTNRTVTLNSGVTNILDIAVAKGDPPFRIVAISSPTEFPDDDTAQRHASSVRLGQSNLFVGVVSKTIPPPEAILRISGDGLAVGPTLVKPNRFSTAFGVLHVLTAPISVSSNATPGLRSFTVQSGTNLAYANGFLEILPNLADYNFDGFDDRFQRRYFPLFTVPEAGPQADPDGDGFSNWHEYTTDSNPRDPGSVRFQIESVTLSRNGTLVRWQSAAGKHFQLYSRVDLGPSPWQPVGSPVLATGSVSQWLDTSARSALRFYRVQLLP